jgi:hypothetical protein
VVAVEGAAVAPTAAVRVTASDTSGAVLPGVTVVASAEGQVLASTVTDDKGTYTFDALPAGRIDLRFELDGFTASVVAVDVRAGAELVAEGRLDLAIRAEAVEVRAMPAPLPKIERPSIVPVPVHDRNSVCGPARLEGAPASLGTIRSLLHESRQGLYAEGDELLIDGGTANGLAVGQNLAVRRPFRMRGFDNRFVSGEHTSGLVQIVNATDNAAAAVVIYACDEMKQGDFLAAVVPEPRRNPEPAGLPQFDDAARVLFADEGQIIGVPERLLVIDRGASGGLRPGQRLTLFRRPRGASTPLIVGDAVVVSLRDSSATIRVERATDVVQFGDFAATQR